MLSQAMLNDSPDARRVCAKEHQDRVNFSLKSAGK